MCYHNFNLTSPFYTANDAWDLTKQLFVRGYPNQWKRSISPETACTSRVPCERNSRLYGIPRVGIVLQPTQQNQDFWSIRINIANKIYKPMVFQNGVSHETELI